MALVDLLQGKVFLCPSETSVRKLNQALQSEAEAGLRPILLIDDGQLRGIIRDFRALVRGYSDFNSPFSVGQLLANVVRASLVRHGADSLVQRLRDGKAGWVELTDPSSAPIAWFPLDEGFRAWLQSATPAAPRVA